ncbi:myeloid-associated differentiation marker-like [Chelmon rostratus]|uniref:myeloid-associated differentiation marker-like n=1 Tax=Chelmon rostratus TaxID=109905 RepID=UPI001BE687E0|nr:myeloid-associated differentiation marker-like [Chelmon rostratus]
MVRVELRAVTQPVGIMRILASILTCLCFSLVAAVGHVPSTYWAWCMFSWCFCFFFTFLIVILEFTTVNTKLPLAWDDFTAAFAMLASLMCLAVSIMYPTFFTCKTCDLQIGASVVSWVCSGVYAGEVALTRLRPSGETSGFLSTLPGILKMLETFLACLIFTSLEANQFSSPGLQWCVAVYILCFIFVILIIVLTTGQLTSYFPFSFDKLVIVYNILAAATYATAVVIWPLYSFGNSNTATGEAWSKLLVVTLMTIFNCIVYTVDSVYSIYLVFCVSNE